MILNDHLLIIFHLKIDGCDSWPFQNRAAPWRRCGSLCERDKMGLPPKQRSREWQNDPELLYFFTECPWVVLPRPVHSYQGLPADFPVSSNYLPNEDLHTVFVTGVNSALKGFSKSLGEG